MQLNRDVLRTHWRSLVVPCVLLLVMVFLGCCLIASPIWLWLKLTVFIAGGVIIAAFAMIGYAHERRLRATNVPTTTELPIINQRNVQIPPMPQNPPSVQPPPFWSLQKTKRLLVFLFGSLVVYTLAPIMSLRWWQITGGIIGIVTLMYLVETGKWGASKLARRIGKLFAQWRKQSDVQVITPSPERYFYYQRPHFTMLVNHIALQVSVWIVVFLGGIYIVHDTMHAPLWLNILLQAWVSLVNTYFIIRAYLQWNGTLYVITENSFIIPHTEDLFFWMRRQTEYLDKGRFVGKKLSRRKIIEFLLLRNRRTIVLELQDVKQPTRRIPYVKSASEFIDGLNASSAS